VLPPGYAQSRLRYPVVYFLHGLPAAPDSYRGNGWLERAIEKAAPRSSSSPRAHGSATAIPST
jgi:hypothetical protein